MKSTKKTPAARWASCRVFFVAVITAVSAATLSGAGPGVASDGQASRSQNPLDRINDEFTGDLPEITERRLLRVLISYSRTNYFVDFATERGFEYELLRKYEEHLNKGRKLSQRIVVTFVPVPLEDLLSELGKGRGDIAAGGLTIAPERQRQVAGAATPSTSETSTSCCEAGGKSRSTSGLHPGIWRPRTFSSSSTLESSG
jgi:ABC-type amino acid transport substrate-binding protein